ATFHALSNLWLSSADSFSPASLDLIILLSSVSDQKVAVTSRERHFGQTSSSGASLVSMTCSHFAHRMQIILCFVFWSLSLTRSITPFSIESGVDADILFECSTIGLPRSENSETSSQWILTEPERIFSSTRRVSATSYLSCISSLMDSELSGVFA